MRQVAVAGALALSLLAAACGGSDGEDGGTTSGSDADANADATDSATDGGEPTPSTIEDGAEASPEALELGQGVTADTIKIGFALPDLALLKELGLADISHGDYELVASTFVDLINEDGGISGRQLEAVFGEYDVIQPTAQEELCTRFVEDEKIFAVLGGVRDENNLCFTELHDTPVFNFAGLNAERQERSDALWATTSERDDARIGIAVQALQESGNLDGRVAIHYTAATEADAATMESELKAAGVNLVTKALVDVPVGDVAANDAQVAVNAERFRSDEIDTVILIGEVGRSVDVMNAAGLDVQFISPSRDLVLVAPEQLADISQLDGILTVAGPTDIEQFEDPFFQSECKEPFEERTGIEVLHPDLVGEGEDLYLASVRNMCQQLYTFRLAAEAAGENLNNDTLLAGLESLGEVAIPAAPNSSFGPGKWDGNNGFAIQVMDTAQGLNGALVSIGDPIVVDRD